jgi:rhodanese-related sulfurtransferase
MKKIFLILIVSVISLFAEVKDAFPSLELINSKTKIIDIRTPGEWRETGLLKGAIPITFFDEQGNYDVDAFLKKLNTHIKPGEEFALICRTGNRTGMVSNYLGTKMGYHVINLKGGILYAIGQKLPIEPYKK